MPYDLIIWTAKIQSKQGAELSDEEFSTLSSNFTTKLVLNADYFGQQWYSMVLEIICFKL